MRLTVALGNDHVRDHGRGRAYPCLNAQSGPCTRAHVHGIVYGLAAVSNSESQVVLRNLLETETNQTVHEAAECALHFD